MIQGQSAHGVRGLVNLFGIESPGLTASLAIAERVASRDAAPHQWATRARPLRFAAPVRYRLHERFVTRFADVAPNASTNSYL